ncbi:hypothetical protein HNR42_000523 [Deinobacterium chartae]|uniref:Serine aminopeptidase S33 domain-containing protein n=1 Tax=Deinobacterium chartae TaxID=521158 RepID=A0A841HY10_9DEIO|nr:alpha/beta fold hydrolase [Deinobacterium chartae]MBB6097109.1 hypothetical protein [Deinobacterium chartae]
MKTAILSLTASLTALSTLALAAPVPVTLEVPGVTLHGTLEVPAGQGPFPVALIIAGSGPTDRNGNNPIAGSNNSLKMLAEGLAARGIATVRYDKRGIGQSAMPAAREQDQTFDDLVNDAAAWMDFLRGDARFGKLAVIGHSEGALIGLAALQKQPAEAYVSVSGTGRNAADILLAQLKPQLPPELYAKSAELVARLRSGQTGEMPDPALAAVFRPSAQPYLISWFRYDPARLIADLQAPALIVQGDRDLQVTLEDARLLAAAQPKAKLLVVPGMNHVLKSAPQDPQGNMATYGNPNLPLAQGLLEGVAEFLEERLR